MEYKTDFSRSYRTRSKKSIHNNVFVEWNLISYILKEHRFEYIEDITDRALTLASHEADHIIRYICRQIKRNNRSALENVQMLTGDMVTRVEYLLIPYDDQYLDISESTCFDIDTLKTKIRYFFDEPMLPITDEAFILILKILHKRFDNMISIAIKFCKALKQTTITKRIMEDSADIVRLCLE